MDGNFQDFIYVLSPRGSHFCWVAYLRSIRAWPLASVWDISEEHAWFRISVWLAEVSIVLTSEFNSICPVCFLPFCGTQNNEWRLTLLPRTHECVALHGKRNLQVYLSWRCGDEEIILGGPNVITRVLLRENQDIREEKRCYAVMLKVEKWATTQRMEVASRRWECQENRYSSWTAEGKQPCWLILDFDL